MSQVELQRLKKSFGAVDIIHGIDLSIRDGEFVALVGPSGCGKSTLLRMIAGLEAVTEGYIVMGGEVVNDLSPRERNIAMVFQSYALYPHMTVAENMGFNLKLSGKSKDEIRLRVAEAARMLDLGSLLDRRPAQLSGGQRQRVAMGRAVVRNPDVFLFDEPLSNLDAKLRVAMRAEIKTLHQTLGTTAIYVTHDQIEAMTLADRIVVLNNGRVEQQGTPLELYRSPVNQFVAGFIGSPAMNFLEGTVGIRAGKAIAALHDGSIVNLGSNLDIVDGQLLVVGMRPEHLVLGHAENAISGIVSLVEPTGAQTHLALQVGKHRVLAVVDGALEVKLGQSLQVGIATERLHLFDKTSGRRIRLLP